MMPSGAVFRADTAFLRTAFATEASPTMAHPVPHRYVFDRAPLRIYWEVTRACSLACRHCRAEASPFADPGELGPAEGKALLAQIAAFGDPKPHVILTGGDPLERADLFDLIAHARSLGLGVSVSPSATPRLTPEVVRRFKDAGVQAISLSIDRATARDHDDLRGVPGCFERTLAAGRAAAEQDLMVQVNTLVSAETANDLPGVHRLAGELRAARWSLFFLVTVGRGEVLASVDPARAQEILEWLADLPQGQGLPVVTTTEAPHFRRIALSRRRLPVVAPRQQGPAAAESAAHARAGYGVRDGNGVVFISHVGEISPSGFLPLAAGHVRDGIVEVYRSSPMFVALRGATGFGGRCGVCDFHAICGGSRARAWTASGDVLGEDPLCMYQPPSDASAERH
jgi:radical SAM protein